MNATGAAGAAGAAAVGATPNTKTQPFCVNNQIYKTNTSMSLQCVRYEYDFLAFFDVKFMFCMKYF